MFLQIIFESFPNTDIDADGSMGWETIDSQHHQIPEGVMMELPFEPLFDKDVKNLKPMKLMVFLDAIASQDSVLSISP